MPQVSVTFAAMALSPMIIAPLIAVFLAVVLSFFAPGPDRPYDGQIFAVFKKLFFASTSNHFFAPLAGSWQPALLQFAPSTHLCNSLLHVVHVRWHLCPIFPPFDSSLDLS